jgi:hypothetical protein
MTDVQASLLEEEPQQRVTVKAGNKKRNERRNGQVEN